MLLVCYAYCLGVIDPSTRLLFESFPEYEHVSTFEVNFVILRSK